MKQSIDLLISHRQIWLRSIKYQVEQGQWGQGNLLQGAILFPHQITFDPIAEGSFGANINILIEKEFDADPNAERIFVVPFHLNETEHFFVSSVAEEHKIKLLLKRTLYEVYYEICVDKEVYINFTFIENDNPQSMALIEDNFGISKDTPLQKGFFD